MRNRNRRGYREEVETFLLRSGERRLPLGLGCAYIGGAGDAETQKQYRKTLDEAYEAGLRYYDTAELYGGSEFRVGPFLRTLDRSSVFVATKSRIPEQLTPEEAALHVYQSLHNSLERLGVSQIDLFQLHAVDTLDQILPEGGVLERLVAARAEGLIRYIGLATRWHDLSMLVAAHPEFDTVLTYLDYNLIDQTAEHLIAYAASKAVGVINGTPLANGLLVGTDPRTHTEMHPEVRRHRPLAIRLYDFCQEHGVSLLALALQYPMRNPDISITLFGPRNPQELHASLDAVQTEIPVNIWAELYRRFRLHLTEEDEA